MLRISPMTDDDIPFAVSMTDIERWGYLPDDFRRLTSFEPEGCFVARVNNERAAIITTTSYDDFGFMGSLIVRGQDRRRGIGETLMRHAMDYLVHKGCRTIELDGVFAAVAIYRRMGFRDKHLSLRLRRMPSSTRTLDRSRPQVTTERLQAFDKEQTGLNRARVLLKYVEDFGDALFACGSTELKGYAFVRPRAGNGGYFAIGPLVATGVEAAESVLCDIVNDRGAWPLVIGIPETNRAAVELALRHGFHYTQPSLRMYFGDRVECAESVFAIGSAEKG